MEEPPFTSPEPSCRSDDSGVLGTVKGKAVISAERELPVVSDRDLDLRLMLGGNKKKKELSSKGKQHLKPKVYTCDFCRKEFPTCQALGGHQNGHKMERTLLKRRRLGAEQFELNGAWFESAIYKPNYYHPLSSSNIINTLPVSNHFDRSRTGIDSFRAYRGNVGIPRKALDENHEASDRPMMAKNDAHHIDSTGVDLNLKLWFQ